MRRFLNIVHCATKAVKETSRTLNFISIFRKEEDRRNCKFCREPGRRRDLARSGRRSWFTTRGFERLFTGEIKDDGSGRCFERGKFVNRTPSVRRFVLFIVRHFLSPRRTDALFYFPSRLLLLLDASRPHATRSSLTYRFDVSLVESVNYVRVLTASPRFCDSLERFHDQVYIFLTFALLC